jgi:hypothetical protein
MGGIPNSIVPAGSRQRSHDIADATEINAPTAVLLAQKLFDIEASVNWHCAYE